MELNQRRACISEKIKNYIEEVYGLKDAGIGYQLGIGFLLIILFPVLIFEILLVILIGKDIGAFVHQKPVEPSVFIVEEVPEYLRDLIPLARRYGIGDDADRDDIMKAASPKELAELEEKVTLRQQEIADWLDTFPETKITDTASFFLYLGSACDEVPLYRSEDET